MDQPVKELEEINEEIAEAFADEIEDTFISTETGYISENALKIIEREEQRVNPPRCANTNCPKCKEGRMTKNGCNFCGWGE